MSGDELKPGWLKRQVDAAAAEIATWSAAERRRGCDFLSALDREQRKIAEDMAELQRVRRRESGVLWA